MYGNNLNIDGSVDAGIEKCYIIDGPKDPNNPDTIPPPSIQTDGISFEGAWSNDGILDVDKITTNDVGSILYTYGVEAARATLMREVSSVFGAYGIAVDPRHLGLIADFMTHQVNWTPPSLHQRSFYLCLAHGTLKRHSDRSRS